MRRGRTRGRQRSRVSRVLSLLVALPVLASTIALVVLAGGSALGRWRVAPVLSGSMTPNIDKGDLVVATPIPKDELRAGDVLLFTAPIAGHPAVVHRIYDVTTLDDGTHAYHTKGDANAGPDAWQIRVQGATAWRVRHVVPKVGAAIEWMHQPTLRMLVLVLSVVMLLLGSLRSIWTSVRPVSWRWLDPYGARHQRAARRVRRRVGAVVVVGIVAVGVLALTGLSSATFTASPAPPVPAFTSGALSAPSPLSCRWSSATALALSWTNASPGFTLSYDVLRSASSGSGYATISSASPDTTVTATDSPSPVTTPKFYVVDAKHGTWASAHSNEMASNDCVGALNLVAGTSVGFSGDNAAATAAALNTPQDVAVDSSGNVYIADTSNNRIRKVDAVTGIITTIAGGGASTGCAFTGAATAATLSGPRGVAVDASGNVYVSDTGNSCIRKISGGTISLFAGGGANTACSFAGTATAVSLSTPRGLAVDGSGSVYLVDTGRRCVRKVSAGNISLVAGSGSGTASACGFSGTATSVILSTTVTGVAIDGSSNVYITDTGQSCVRKVSAGTVSLLAGGGATTACSFAGAASSASLSAPAGIAVDSSGRVVIADGGRRCVRIVSSGNVSQLAGTGTSGSTGDNGPAIAALFTTPSGVAATPSGDVWIADAGTHRVRRVEGPV